MQTFELDVLTAELAGAGRAWAEFLRVPSLSMGVYRLAAGDTDRQTPHTEDEVYYVVRGRATFQSAGERRPVRPGTILFVERNVEHQFADITEDLTVLVFFAPAEHSLRDAPTA